MDLDNLLLRIPSRPVKFTVCFWWRRKRGVNVERKPYDQVLKALTWYVSYKEKEELVTGVRAPVRVWTHMAPPVSGAGFAEKHDVWRGD